MSRFKNSPVVVPPNLKTREVLELVPLSRTAWLNGVAAGLYPQPIRLGRTLTWRRTDIERLLEKGTP